MVPGRMDRSRKLDIDYHVTFPTPNFETGKRDDFEDEVSEEEGFSKKEPVVILLGWAGCKDRNLAKYSAIYEKRCITIRYIAPNYDIFFRSTNLRLAAEKILDLIIDLELVSHPIFVHSFSNGGGLVYRWISDLVHHHKDYNHIKVVGSVFDSCPGKRKISRLVKVLMMMTSDHSRIVGYLFCLAVLCFIIINSFMLTLSKVLHLGSHTPDYWTAIQEDPSLCPQLYLYSAADDIIEREDVEFLIEARKHRGIKVKSICWEDSAHVSHLLKHRESYMKACHDFIDFCTEQHTAANSFQ